MTTMSNATYGSALERSKSVLLILLQVVVSCVAVFFVRFQSMSVAGCGDRCDYSLLTVTSNGILAISIVALLLSIVIVIVRGQRGAPSWWAPLGATALVVASTVVAVGLVQVATQ